MQSEQIAKKSVKISIISLFILLILGMIVGSISLTQINAMAQMDRKIKTLEQDIKRIESRLNLAK